MDEGIGAIGFPSSDDQEALVPTPGKGGGGGSIAERRAAKLGFNAGKINTPRFRTDSPMASPGFRSPCITIPPGISPTSLLDSPIMLSNCLAIPSPTTGTFPFLPHNSVMNSETGEDGDKSNRSGSFKFRPSLDPKSLLCISSFGLQEAEAANQAVVLEQQRMGFEFATEFPGQAMPTNYSVGSSNSVKVSNSMVVNAMKLSPDVVSVSEQSLSREPMHREDSVTHDISEGNHSAYNPEAGVVARSSEDGYNWRKYGQKQVKGSEYPRSYYKCTHPNCPVKKKVERSHDGQITEIIYKGAHNHAKPQANRRPGLQSAFSFDEMSEVSEGTGTCLKVDGGSVWTNIQSGSDVRLGSDGRSDGLEITSSASILTDMSDPVSTTHGKSIGTIESTETPEQSSTFASHDDDEDGATQGSLMSQGGDADGEESESKRRKKESSVVETTLITRAVREPRVVVQIESEVDILDDGYRWRKYGQKVVKGNPNPRSYYKCTSTGCMVRKHVERASQNLKCVITTYEGKHNHEVPAARNSSLMNSAANATNHSAAAHNAPSALTLPRNSTIPKPEIHMHDYPPQFDRKLEFGNDYMRPNFPGSFANDVRFGPPPPPPPSIYQMKYPPLQNPTLPYPYGLNPNRFAPQQASSMPSILPDFPMSMPQNLALPPGAHLPLVGGYDFNPRKSVAPVQPLPSSQQQTDMRFLRPKQEQRDDSVYNPSVIDQPNGQSLSSAYNRMMGRFQQ